MKITNGQKKRIVEMFEYYQGFSPDDEDILEEAKELIRYGSQHGMSFDLVLDEEYEAYEDFVKEVG